MSPASRRPVLVLLLLAAAALLLPGLGRAPLERAEIYFVDAARAMAEQGDWLVPHYRGEPFFDKPALTYWLMGLSLRLLGTGLFAARAVSVLAALGVLAATWALGRRLYDEATATTAAVVLGTTVLFLSFGRLAMSDMLLTLWSTLAVLLGVALLQEPGPPSAGRQAALGAVLGLGFLTKGPIALLLTGCGLIALGWARRRRPPLSVAGVAAAAAAFAVCGLGWFALLWLRLGTEPLVWFFLRENLERFAGETYDAGRPAIFYLGAWLAVGLPWSALLPLAAVRAPRGERALLAWAALVLLPLSLSRGKLDYYLLPLSPALSLLVARHLGRAPSWTALDRAWVRAVLVLFALGMLAVVLVETRVPADWLPGPPGRWALRLAGLAAAAAALAAVPGAAPRRLLGALAGGTAAVHLVLVGAFLPAFRAAQPNQRVVRDVERELRYQPEAALAYCADPARVERDVLFSARLPAEHRCELWGVATSHQPYLFLLQPQERRSLSRVPGYREIRQYRCLPATALTLGQLVAGLSPQWFTLAANYGTTDPVAESKRKRVRRRALWEEEGAEAPSPEGASPTPRP